MADRVSWQLTVMPVYYVMLDFSICHPPKINTALIVLCVFAVVIKQLENVTWRSILEGSSNNIIIIRIFTQDNPSVQCTVISGVLHIELN